MWDGVSLSHSPCPSTTSSSRVKKKQAAYDCSALVMDSAIYRTRLSPPSYKAKHFQIPRTRCNCTWAYSLAARPLGTSSALMHTRIYLTCFDRHTSSHGILLAIDRDNSHLPREDIESAISLNIVAIFAKPTSLQGRRQQSSF